MKRAGQTPKKIQERNILADGFRLPANIRIVASKYPTQGSSPGQNDAEEKIPHRFRLVNGQSLYFGAKRRGAKAQYHGAKMIRTTRLSG